MSYSCNSCCGFGQSGGETNPVLQTTEQRQFGPWTVCAVKSAYLPAIGAHLAAMTVTQVVALEAGSLLEGAPAAIGQAPRDLSKPSLADWIAERYQAGDGILIGKWFPEEGRAIAVAVPVARWQKAIEDLSKNPGDVCVMLEPTSVAPLPQIPQLPLPPSPTTPTPSTPSAQDKDAGTRLAGIKVAAGVLAIGAVVALAYMASTRVPRKAKL